MKQLLLSDGGIFWQETDRPLGPKRDTQLRNSGAFFLIQNAGFFLLQASRIRNFGIGSEKSAFQEDVCVFYMHIEFEQKSLRQKFVTETIPPRKITLPFKRLFCRDLAINSIGMNPRDIFEVI